MNRSSNQFNLAHRRLQVENFIAKMREFRCRLEQEEEERNRIEGDVMTSASRCLTSHANPPPSHSLFPSESSSNSASRSYFNGFGFPRSSSSSHSPRFPHLDEPGSSTMHISAWQPGSVVTVELLDDDDNYDADRSDASYSSNRQYGVFGNETSMMETDEF